MSGFVFGEKPIEIERGDGPYLYGADGTEYLDVGASYACVPLGHGHEAVTGAVRDQLERLTYVQASYPVGSRTTATRSSGPSTPPTSGTASSTPPRASWAGR